jgi:flagellar export protein FliJ
VEQKQHVAERRQDVETQKERVVALAKDAKALEKLRERQLEEHQQEDSRREQAETSEIASVRHQRLQVSAS